MAESTTWRICADNGWWSAFGKRKRGKTPRPGRRFTMTVGRQFAADAPNRLWLAAITEHRTAEGKLYPCAIKDAFSNRIVGYSIDSLMKSRLATQALASAVARRGDGRLHRPQRPRIANFGADGLHTPWAATTWPGPWARSARPATTQPWRASSACCERTS